MARRKLASGENAGFGGMDLAANPQRLPAHTAQIDKNGDHRWPQSWRPRPGLARTSLAKQTGICRNIIWFRDRSGIDRIMFNLVPSTNPGTTGTLEGAPLPGNNWNPEPQNLGGGGMAFDPVTNLAVSDTDVLELTWTNPTSAFWAGTKIMRRTDCYPQGPNDPDAEVIYNGRAATAEDTALVVGQTGYYSAYAYSSSAWALPAKASGVKTSPYFVAVGSRTGSVGAAYSNDGGTTWNLATGAAQNNAWALHLGGDNVIAVQASSGAGLQYAIMKSTDRGLSYTAIGTLDLSASFIAATIGKPIKCASGRISVPVRSTEAPAISHFLAAYSDDGITWTAGADIATTGNSGQPPAIAEVTGGTLVTVAQKSSVDATIFTVKRSTNGGQTWGAEITTLTLSGVQVYLWAKGATLFLVATEGGVVKVFRSADSGATWAAVLTPTTIASLGSFGSLGTVLGFVFQKDANNFIYYYSTDDGLTWSAGQTFSGGAGISAKVQGLCNSLGFGSGGAASPTWRDIDRTMTAKTALPAGLTAFMAMVKA